MDLHSVGIELQFGLKRDGVVYDAIDVACPSVENHELCMAFDNYNARARKTPSFLKFLEEMSVNEKEAESLTIETEVDSKDVIEKAKKLSAEIARSESEKEGEDEVHISYHERLKFAKYWTEVFVACVKDDMRSKEFLKESKLMLEALYKKDEKAFSFTDLKTGTQTIFSLEEVLKCSYVDLLAIPFFLQAILVKN